MSRPEKQTKEKLLQAAKSEFLEKGYMGASLRNICKKADVTTGALYFFFQDKEDLFASFVEEPLEQVYVLMKAHYESELESLQNLNLLSKEIDTSNDIETVRQMVNFMFAHHDAFTLLLTKSHGSRFENCTDRFMEVSEKHYRVLSDWMSAYYKIDRLDDYLIHWFAHLQIFSITQLITHDLTKEEALRQMDNIAVFLINGWFAIFKSNGSRNNK